MSLGVGLKITQIEPRIQTDSRAGGAPVVLRPWNADDRVIKADDPIADANGNRRPFFKQRAP